MAARTKVDRAEFVELATQGLSNKELQERFQASASTITRMRRDTGTSYKPSLTPERKARIEQMLDDGWSFKEISRTEGANMETLRKHFPGRQWTLQQRIEHQATLRAMRGLRRYAA